MPAILPATTAAPSRAERATWFEGEVQAHEKDLRAYLRSRFPGMPDVDDVVQESFLRIYNAHPTGRIISTKAYLFSIARNVALKIFRKQRIFSPVPVNELPDWRVLEGGPDAADTTSLRDRLDLLASAIDRLPARCGEIMGLAVIDGLSAVEIAERLGLSENTVRVQLARGLKKCVQYFREHDDAR